MDGTSTRGHQRVLVQKEVTINGIIKAYLLDISEGGAYVHTQAEFIVGATLELSFTLHDNTVTIKAVVQHAQPGIGVGLKFVTIAPSVLATLKRYIEAAPPIPTREEKRGSRKILLVDDSSQSRAIYRNKLNAAGYSVVEATNGVEALKYLHDTSFDLVILDLWMEGIDGFKVMQLMQMNQNLQDIPVMMLSARNVPEEIQKALDLGAKEFLPKMTTSPVKLLERVKALLP